MQFDLGSLPAWISVAITTGLFVLALDAKLQDMCKKHREKMLLRQQELVIVHSKEEKSPQAR